MADADADAHPPLWRILWLAVRPKTLSIAVAPVFVGMALASAQFDRLALLAGLAALCAAILIQAGTNLHNDAADYLSGTDTDRRAGPVRATAQGWLSPRQTGRLAVLSFGLAALIGLYLIYLGGWPIFALGLASIAAGLLYSAGPMPIARGPGGEIAVIAFFGLGAVCGTVWLTAGMLDATAPLCGLVVGLPAAAVLFVNNTRDQATDFAAGRRTLALAVTRKTGRRLYATLLLLPLGLIVAGTVLVGLKPGALFGLIALPEAARLIRAFQRAADGPDFNALLARTARYQLLLSLSLAGGLLISDDLNPMQQVAG